MDPAVLLLQIREEHIRVTAAEMVPVTTVGLVVGLLVAVVPVDTAEMAVAGAVLAILGVQEQVVPVAAVAVAGF